VSPREFRSRTEEFVEYAEEQFRFVELREVTCAGKDLDATIRYDSAQVLGM
jgi:hypothetical protein